MTSEELCELIEKLLNMWELGPNEPILARGGWTHARFATLWGLAGHTHEAARAVLRLIDAGIPDLLLAPLVRTCLEFGVTAHWCLRVQDSAESLLNEAHRQRRNLYETLSRVPGTRAFMGAVPRIPDEQHATSSGLSGRRFNERCLDLVPGGEELYAQYAGLSQLSHAGPAVVEFYASLTGLDVPVSLEVHPKEAVGQVWLLWLTAVSVLWAAWAVDVRRQGRPHRSALRNAAAELAVEIDLKATDRVWLREHPGKKS